MGRGHDKSHVCFSFTCGTLAGYLVPAHFGSLGRFDSFPRRQNLKKNETTCSFGEEVRTSMKSIVLAVIFAIVCFCGQASAQSAVPQIGGFAVGSGTVCSEAKQFSDPTTAAKGFQDQTCPTTYTPLGVGVQVGSSVPTTSEPMGVKDQDSRWVRTYQGSPGQPEPFIRKIK